MFKKALSLLLALGLSVSALTVPATAEETHVCSFTEAGHSEASCQKPEMTLYTCSCGAESYDVVSPALGHDFSDWEKSGTYQSRTCARCGFSEEKAVRVIPDTLNLYAIGDSITFGQKVTGYTEGSYAKLLADELSLPYINHAVSGTRTMAWRSAVTGKPDKNGVVHEHAGGTPAEKIRSEIEKAGLVVFTLGTNDMFAGVRWNPPATVAGLVTDLIDGIHEINPDAIVVALGGAYSEAYWRNGTYDRDGLPKGMADLTTELVKALNTDAYKDYAYFVDITDILSDHASYTECTGEPDGLHPGAVGNRRMKDSVIKALGLTTVGEPEVTYSVTVKNGEDIVASESRYGLYTLPDAPTGDGFFEGWRDNVTDRLYAAGEQALIKENHVFVASYRTLADSSLTYSFGGYASSVEGALYGFSESAYDAESATETARVTEKDADGNVTKVRFAYSVTKSVDSEDMPILKLTCDEYTATGWQNSAVALPSPMRSFAQSHYVAVSYRYSPVNPSFSVIGRRMTLILTSGGKSYYVESEEPIVADEQTEALFDLTKLRENAASNLAVNYGSILDEPIDGIKLMWYDTDQKAGTHGGFRATVGDTFSFRSVTFFNNELLLENEVTYTDGDELFLAYNAYGDITLPDAPKTLTRTFLGWSDGTKLYAPNSVLNVDQDMNFTAVWKTLSPVTDNGNGHYTVDYLVLNGKTEGLLEDRFRSDSVTVSYDAASDTASIVRNGNYGITASAVESDGERVLCVKSTATGQAWNGPSLTTVGSLPFTLESAKTVKVNYRYDGTDLVGQKMRMILNVGTKNYNVESTEPIVRGMWAKATFDFSSVFSADADFESVKSSPIARTRLYFYDTVMLGDYAAYSTAYSFAKDTSFLFGKYDYFAKVYTARFICDGNTVSSASSADEITLPQAPVKAGYAFAGWSDGEKLYTAGESYTLTHDTDFTAVWIEDSGIEKVGDTYRINYAKLLGTVNGILEDYYRQSVVKNASVSYDEATATATLERTDGKTKIEASLCDFQGKRTIKYTSVASSGAWDGPSVTTEAALPFPLSGAQRVTVDYFYGGSALVGQKMRMILYSGDKFYTVESDETIENWGWRTVTFDFTDVFASSPDFDGSAPLTLSRLYFYEAPMNGNYAFSQSYRFGQYNEMYFADYTYTGKAFSSPAFTVGETSFFLNDDSDRVEITASGTVNLDYPIQRDGKAFVGWYYDALHTEAIQNGDSLSEGLTAYADFIDISETDLSVVGAQIRLDDVGLRFVFDISHKLRSTLAALHVDNACLLPESESFNTSSEQSHYGTRILPTEFLGGSSIYSADRFPYNGTDYSPALVPARKIFRVESDSDLFTTVVTDITTAHYRRAYTVSPYIVYTDASGVRRTVGGEEYSASLYDIADYAVNQVPESLTDEQKAFLTENILNKAQ